MAQDKPAKQQKEVQTVKFYPNPAISFINFEFTAKPRVQQTVYIFNFLGKKVIEQVLSGQKTTVTLSDLYRGVYIFQIRDSRGVITDSGKFQVVK